MNTWKYVDYISAGVKVAYDKIYDCMIYYGTFSFANESENESENINENENAQYTQDVCCENTINNELIDNKYTDEDNNKRIFKAVGFINEYRNFFNEPTHIIDNLYLGSAFNAASYTTLKNNNIKIIINVSKELSKYYKNEFEYVQYPIYDNNKDKILEHLDNAYQFILERQQELHNFDKSKISVNDNDKWKGNILIHCYMGASRSASIVIYYLIKKQKLNFDDALDYIKNKRSHVNLTHRFRKDITESIMIQKN